MSLRVSNKYGVNPSQDICMYCGEVKHILLLGRLPGDVEAPKRVCLNPIEPCDSCKTKFEEQKAVIFVEATLEDGKPVITGNLIGVHEDVARQVLEHSFVEEIVSKHRIALISPEHFTLLGLREILDSNNS